MGSDGEQLDNGPESGLLFHGEESPSGASGTGSQAGLFRVWSGVQLLPTPRGGGVQLRRVLTTA